MLTPVPDPARPHHPSTTTTVYATLSFPDLGAAVIQAHLDTIRQAAERLGVTVEVLPDPLDVVEPCPDGDPAA